MTEHFSFNELTNSSHIDLVAQNRIDAQKIMPNLTLLANALEEAREILGCPLIVSSGYRNEALNKVVGGSSTSKHKLGLCADFEVRGLDIDTAFTVLHNNKNRLKLIKKIIIEKVGNRKWIHLQAKSDIKESTDFYSTVDGKNYTKITSV